MMDVSQRLVHEEMLVSDVLAMGPKAVEFFMKKRFGCVGCSMAAFCTLADVIKNYDLPKEAFLLELENVLQG